MSLRLNTEGICVICKKEIGDQNLFRALTDENGVMFAAHIPCWNKAKEGKDDNKNP